MVSVPNCYNEDIYRGLAGHACLSMQTHVWEIRAVCSSVCTCVWLKEGWVCSEGLTNVSGGTPCPSSMPIAEVKASTSLLRISGPWEAERLLAYGRRGACGTPATYSQAWPCGCALFCSLTFSASSCLYVFSLLCTSSPVLTASIPTACSSSSTYAGPLCSASEC